MTLAGSLLPAWRAVRIDPIAGDAELSRLSAMRSCVIITLSCVMCGGAPAAQNHLGALGITEGRAKEAVFDSFITDTLSVAGDGKAFTAASSAARVALVNFALALARTFAESDDFKRRYADHREANGPDPLPAEPSVDEILAKQRAGFEAQVEQMRKLFDQITPEQRATLEEGWKDMRAQLTEMETGPAARRVREGVARAARDACPRARGGDEAARRRVAGRPPRARRRSPAALPRGVERRRLRGQAGR